LIVGGTFIVFLAIFFALRAALQYYEDKIQTRRKQIIQE